MKKRRVRKRENSVAKVEASTAGSRFMSFFDVKLVGSIMAIKAIVLLYGAQSFVVWSNRGIGSLYQWFSIWNRWDTPHYLEIARTGYVAEGVDARRIVFFPLYPWLVRAFGSVFQDELSSAFFVSTVASIVAGLLLYRLVGLDEEDKMARATVFLLFIFPTSFFLHIGYTESLFISLAVGAFLSARERSWWLAGLLSCLSAMTRANGLLLIPALGFEAFEEYRNEGRRWRWQWLWIAAGLLGFGVYLLINWKVFGNPFEFLNKQEQNWSRSLTWPWVGISAVWHSIWERTPTEGQMVGWQELFFIMLGLTLSIWACLRLRASYAIWISLNWLLWTSTRFVQSVPRYMLAAFPAFILLAQAATSKSVWNVVITVWSILFLALFISRFVLGFWAF